MSGLLICLYFSDIILVVCTVSIYNKSPRGPRSRFSFFLQGQYFSYVLCCPQQCCFLDNFQPHVHADLLYVLLKSVYTAPKAPITTGTTKTFHMRQIFAISSFNSWYFSIFTIIIYLLFYYYYYHYYYRFLQSYNGENKK